MSDTLAFLYPLLTSIDTENSVSASDWSRIVFYL